MFGIDSGEILIIAVVALVVIGPKDLPRVMRTVGQYVGRAKGMARHFRSGLDTMMREAELEEMEKKWRAENERIMREHPLASPDSDWGKPAAQIGSDDPGVTEVPENPGTAPASNPGTAPASLPSPPDGPAPPNRPEEGRS